MRPAAVYRACSALREESTMPRTEADKIRNVALVGHRGSGKTSLNEALLFQAGAINRLGSVADGSTISDSAPDEKSREMSISSALASFGWQDRKINLIDTPGEPSFVGDAQAAMRVSEGAVFVVNAVMGVEVNTDRLWERAAELEMYRLLFIYLVDRERADSCCSLDSLTSAFVPDGSKRTVAFGLKTLADPFAGRINLFRVYQGTLKADSQVQNCRAHVKERIGQLLVPQGKEMGHSDEFGPGDIGAVAKLKETHAGDTLAASDGDYALALPPIPAPVMAFAMEPKTKGDEDKVFTALRRLQEEDPTIDLHRDAQTGEQIVAGLSQIHVEVIVDRMKERFGAEVTLKPPRVPYLETIKGKAKAHGRYKKQTGGRGQFGDCHIEIEPLPQGEGFEFVNAIKGGVIPSGFIPAVEKGIREAMTEGVVAGYPMKDLRVRLYDGSYHSVDSSEMAFKIAGSMAFKQAAEHASPTLLEPIMTVTVTVPEASVGDVIGDLNGRRGRPLGMEPKGGMTEVKAEVPMSEVLSYAPDLRSITGGQGDYAMEFARYEEVPAHLAQKVISAAREEAEAVKA